MCRPRADRLGRAAIADTLRHNLFVTFSCPDVISYNMLLKNIQITTVYVKIVLTIEVVIPTAHPFCRYRRISVASRARRASD